MLFKMFKKPGTEVKKVSARELMGLDDRSMATPAPAHIEKPPRIIEVLDSASNKYFEYDIANDRMLGEYREDEQAARSDQKFSDARKYMEDHMDHGGELPPIPEQVGDSVYEVPIREDYYNNSYRQEVNKWRPTVNASAKGWD